MLFYFLQLHGTGFSKLFMHLESAGQRYRFVPRKIFNTVLQIIIELRPKIRMGAFVYYQFRPLDRCLAADFGYALAGPLPQDRMMALAQSVYRQR